LLNPLKKSKIRKMTPENKKNLPPTQIIKRNGMVVGFDKSKIEDSIYCAVVAVGGTDMPLAKSLADKVVDLLGILYYEDEPPSVEDVQDIIEKVLVENGHYKTAKAYILYRAEHARIREKKDSVIVAEDNVPYKVLWKVFTWNVENECDTLGKLNRSIENGTFTGLVTKAENSYAKEIKKVAARVIKNKDEIKLFIVAGPSSSGKTTTTIKIVEELKRCGLDCGLISLDNYFRDLEAHPCDEFGDYDFEGPEALDLPLINEHITRLIAGEAVKIPQYNFKTGKREGDGKEFRLNEGQLLIVDSLHGLNPSVTGSIKDENKFKFYIETLCQLRDKKGEFIRWTDLRMLRRMARDSIQRSYNPEQTAGHWHYVRRSEKKYIVPFINKADYIFNGALSYELPLYKKHLFTVLGEITKKFENNPKKLDAYIRAKRVYDLLNEVREVNDESCIPRDSVIREFIGGSSYKY
jgi:uridine kinase